MNAVIVDASVAIKWFIPEVHALEARLWRNSGHELHVPSFFFDLEIANILWKKVQRNEIASFDAESILAQLPVLPVVRDMEPPLLSAAFDLAVRTQRTTYDCLYLALAVQLNGRMVTADQRFYNSIAGSPWGSHICWVADVPAVP